MAEPETPEGFTRRRIFRLVRSLGVAGLVMTVYLLVKGRWADAGAFGAAGALLAVVGHIGARSGREKP